MAINLSGSNGVDSSGNIVTNGEVSAVGNITGNYFIGNGRYLTGITGGAGNVDLTAITTDVIPASNVALSLGNATNQWKELWVSNSAIYMNSVPISLSANNDLLVNSVPVVLSSNTAPPQTANISTTAAVVADNIVANSFSYANGQPFSGSYGNANVEAYLPSSNTIIAINTDLANTNSDVANINTEVTNLSIELTNTDANVANLSTSVTYINGNIVSLTSSLANTDSNIANTNSNVANTNATVANLTTSLTNTNSNVANLTTSLTNTNSNVANTNSNVANLNLSLAQTNGNVANLQANAYSNINVSSYLSNANTTGNIYATNINAANTITATTFIGNFQGNITGNLVVPGSNTWVLYNAGGNAGADIGFRYNAATKDVVVGNTVTANFFVGNGSQLTGLPAAYGNANVEAYLPTSNTIIAITSNVANLTIGLANTNANVANLQASAYSNVNTAAYLDSYTGNISAGNITVTRNVSANTFVGNSMTINGNIVVSGNANIQGTLTYNNTTSITTSNLVLGLANNQTGINVTGAGIVAGNTNEASFLYNYTSQSWNSNLNLNVTGNVTANYFVGNGSQLTGLPASYGNANVEAYLPTSPYIANITSNIANTNSNVANLTTSLANTNSNVANTNSNVANLNLSLAQTNSDVANLQASAYSNINTAAYLANANTTGNIYATNINAANTITATTFIGNFQGNITGNLVVPGANTWVLYNDSGNAGADVGFTYNAATKNVVVGNTVTANFFVGNGSQLTGLPAAYGNANVEAYLPSSNTIISINGNVANTNSNLANLTTSLANTNSNVANLVTVINSTNANVANLTTSLANTNSNVANTNSNVANLTTSLSNTNSNVANLTTSLSNTNSNIANLTTSLANTNSNLANLTTSLANTNSNVANLVTITTNTNANVANLTTSLTSTNSNVANTNANVANLSTALANIASNVTTLQGQVYANANVFTYLGSNSNVVITTTSNVTGGNILTSGRISVTGNVTGNYFVGNGSQLSGIANIVNGTSNVQVFNNGNIAISVGGSSNAVVISTGRIDTSLGISSSANVLGNNVYALGSGGIVTATGNVIGGNIVTAGRVTATGNVTGGNVIASTAVFVGNRSIQNPPTFMVRSSGGNIVLTVPFQETKVPFGNVEYDSDSWYSTSTNRYTPQLAGYYQIETTATVYPPTAPQSAQGSILIRKNNTSITGVSSFGAVHSSVSRVVQMNGTTDYIDIAISNGSNGNVPQETGITVFSGFWVRP